MVKVIEGQQKGKGLRIGVVVSRFNDFITRRLLEACCEELRQLGVKDRDVFVVWVPGAFEIPSVAKELAVKKTIDAVICLGAVIKGETTHFELVANETARGIAQVNLASGKPVVFEVLTTETVKLAEDRAQENGYNKGREAADTAVEMVDVMNQTKKLKL